MTHLLVVLYFNVKNLVQTRADEQPCEAANWLIGGAEIVDVARRFDLFVLYRLFSPIITNINLIMWLLSTTRAEELVRNAI